MSLFFNFDFSGKLGQPISWSMAFSCPSHSLLDLTWSFHQLLLTFSIGSLELADLLGFMILSRSPI